MDVTQDAWIFKAVNKLAARNKKTEERPAF
jgi:hypothetical protein